MVAALSPCITLDQDLALSSDVLTLLQRVDLGQAIDLPGARRRAERRATLWLHSEAVIGIGGVFVRLGLHSLTRRAAKVLQIKHLKLFYNNVIEI